MSTINLQFKGACALLELNRPKAHAINLQMVEELREILISLREGDHIRGVVLTGQANIFCAGLDILELYDFKESQLDHFFHEFHHLMLELVRFPKPLIAAINGHAPAGGCILALCCDYRVMAEGDFKIGLNEVPFGIVTPAHVVGMAAFSVGHANAARMLLDALLLTPAQALGIGLIDAVEPQAEVVEAAFRKMAEWHSYSDTVWRKTKERLRKPLVHTLDVDPVEAFGETIRAWWSPETRALLSQFVDNMTKKT